MNDIDFDELDRAVNSLISGTAKTASEAETGRKGPADAETSGAVRRAGEIKEQSTPIAVRRLTPAPAPAAKPAGKPPLASRRAGRMMDVVRAPALQPTRQRSSELVPPSVRPSREAPAVQPVAPGESPIGEVSAAHTSDGPLINPGYDYHIDGFLDGDEEATYLLDDGIDDTAPLPSAPPVAVEDQTTEPADTPFISAAGIEKRPLGAAAGPQGGLTALPQKQPDHSSRLPEELTSELMALESGSAARPQVRINRSPAVARPAGAVYSAPGPALKEHPVAIFDTEDYHQPLKYRAHDDSGWRFVFAIILLLILGALSGAALYYFGVI